MPSTGKPRISWAMAYWNARTHASVLGPKTPSTFSVCPFLLFRKLAWSCTARTAGPVLPWCTVTTRARQVAPATTPVAGRWRARWNATTAALVLGPDTPSTISLAPWALKLLRTSKPRGGDGVQHVRIVEGQVRFVFLGGV